MITFFDPKRGAELEEEVVNQGVLINTLIAKIHALEVTLHTQNSRYDRDLRRIQNDVNKLQHNVRTTATSHGVNVWDMESMRDRLSSTRQASALGESIRGIDGYNPYSDSMYSVAYSPGSIRSNEDVWQTMVSPPSIGTSEGNTDEF